MDNIEPRFFRVLEKVSSTIDRNENRCLETDKREQHELEWKQVSLVIDRLLLVVFFLAMTIASLMILTSSPHLQLDFSWAVCFPLLKYLGWLVGSVTQPLIGQFFQDCCKRQKGKYCSRRCILRIGFCYYPEILHFNGGFYQRRNNKVLDNLESSKG